MIGRPRSATEPGPWPGRRGRVPAGRGQSSQSRAPTSSTSPETPPDSSSATNSDRALRFSPRRAAVRGTVEHTRRGGELRAPAEDTISSGETVGPQFRLARRWRGSTNAIACESPGSTGLVYSARCRGVAMPRRLAGAGISRGAVQISAPRRERHLGTMRGNPEGTAGGILSAGRRPSLSTRCPGMGRAIRGRRRALRRRLNRQRLGLDVDAPDLQGTRPAGRPEYGGWPHASPRR